MSIRKQKNPVGRPALPAKKLRKNTSKTIRVTIQVADDLRAIARLYDAGTITKANIKSFIKKYEIQA